MPKLSEIDATLTTVGKPGDGGCCYTNFGAAPTFPADATTKLSTLEGWESLGELSTDGFTESKSVSAEELKGWHNTTLQVADGDESKKYKAVFVEVNRPTAAKVRYGNSNVKAGVDGSVSHIADKYGVDTTVPLIFDELESNGYLRRTIVRKAHVTGFDEIAHRRGSLMGYGVEFTVLDPGNGVNPVDIYRAKPAGA